MQIPAWPQAGEREAELLRLVLESPQWGGFHPFVGEFEESFAAYQHSAFGISAANGTVTLEAVLSLLGIGSGDEVIIPAISFIATATAVSRVGATPVFVDIEPLSFNIDPERVQQAISSRTKAVIAVHFGGAMCEIVELQRICAEHNLILIEDAAHAHGSEWKGKRAGSFGLVGSFSFQNSKVLAAGEGGLVVTSDRQLADRIRSFANCGRTVGRPFFEHAVLGTNLRLSAFPGRDPAGATGAASAADRHAHGECAALEDRNGRYRTELRWQEQPPECTQNSFYLLLGRARNTELRQRIYARLSAADVPCTPFYPHTLYQNPLYQQGGCRVMPCPVSEECITDAFWLSHNALLADEETVSQIGNIIRSAIAGQTTSVSVSSGSRCV